VPTTGRTQTAYCIGAAIRFTMKGSRVGPWDRLESPRLQDVSHCWHSKAVEMLTQNAVTFPLRALLGESLTAGRLCTPFQISIT
jgi:hypothetical protein